MGEDSSDCDHAFEPIAIVGIGCRFPGGAASPDSFWEFICGGGNGIVEIPEDRWKKERFFDTNSNALQASPVKWGGFIDDVAEFDAAFFDISPREADAMDPQQRIMLEVTYEALQDANMTIAAASRAVTGVFVGISMTDYRSIQEHGTQSNDIFAGTDCISCIIANRISHRLNLSGPSYTVDTACSSSLVALDQACRNLNDGACDVAIAAGVNVNLVPVPFIIFSKANMLSTTGFSGAFDAEANGFVRGEGAGVLILKPLSAAVRDEDRVYAVIRGTCVNQDGRTTTLTAPNQSAQISMLSRLCRVSGVDPASVGYVEAHGTSTPIGDPIEAGAIGQVFGKARMGAPIQVGSVKTNLGHLESAAGIAGVIKTALVVQNRAIPPSRNFTTPNPHIAFDALNIEVAERLTPLPDIDGRYLAVANSFGYGGTNATAMLESHGPHRGTGVRRSPHAETRAPQPTMLPLSAATDSSLRAYADALEQALAPDGSLAHASLTDVAGGFANYRDHLSNRAVFLANGADDMRAMLEAFARDDDEAYSGLDDPPAIITGHAQSGRRIVFTYAGQGSQRCGMGRDLMRGEPVYRQAVEAFDAVYGALSGTSVIDALLAPEERSRIHESEISQPAIVALQIGLTALWRHYAIEPDVVIGHSLGEISAAHAAGALSLEAVARFVHTRSQIRRQHAAKGAIAAIGLPADQVERLLPDDGSVTIAGYNGPAMITVSGDHDAVHELADGLAAKGMFVRLLATDTAWHSHHLDDARDWFTAGIRDLEWRTPRLPFVSTVTGKLEGWLDPDYWWRNLRHPVRYADAVGFAFELGATTFLELGPQRTLGGLTASCAGASGRSVSVLASLAADRSDRASMAVTAARLYVEGADLNWDALIPSDKPKLDLPKYPWTKQRHWKAPEEAQWHLFADRIHPLLGWREKAPTPQWSAEFNLKSVPYLAHHTIQGSALFPAAGYFEMMFAAGLDYYGKLPIELENVRIFDALFIGEEDNVMFRTVLDPERGRLRVFSRIRDGAEQWTLRTQALVRQWSVQVPEREVFDPSAESTAPVEHTEFYESPADVEFWDFGPQFLGVQRVWYRPAGPVAEVSCDEALREQLDDYVAHPAFMDSCLHIIDPISFRFWKQRDASRTQSMDRVFLPVGARRIRLFAPLRSDSLFSSSDYGDGASDVADARHCVRDPDGHAMLTIEGMIYHELAHRVVRSPEKGAVPELYIETYQPAERPEEPVEPAVEPGKWLFLADDAGRVEALMAELGGRGAEVACERLDTDDTGTPGRLDALTTRLEELLQDETDLRAVVFAQSLSQDGIGDLAETTALLERTEPDVLDLLALGKALDALGYRESYPDIWLLTRRARPVSEGQKFDAAGLVQAPLISLLRNIANECPEHRIAQIDVDESALAEPAALVDVLLTERNETEMVVRGDERLVPRIERRRMQELPFKRNRIDASDAKNCVVTMDSPGLVDDMLLREADEPDVPARSVKVRIKAVGLNFRDVMAVTGLLPKEAEPDAAWRNLGLEFSGIVEETGANVSTLKPGDRVMGLGRRCLQRFMVLPADAVSRFPDHISFEQAATVPSVFATAHYALNHVGRLRPGEKVLIHVATGGVGLAAVQLAKRAGAEIFATAGNEEKRAHLRSLGIRHVMNSRDLSFADEILKATDGRGVDVVLNSLPGDFITKGLDVLAPFGRFLEIGKRDVYADSAVGLKALSRNITVSVIDVAALGAERPDLLKSLVGELNRLFHEQALQPLPYTAFPVGEVTRAFRFMSEAKHIGKIVVTFDQPAFDVSVSPERPLRFRQDASYLITGGTRGFSLAIADWLSACGAGRLVLASRSGEVAETDQPLLRRVRERGTEVDIVRLDVTDAAAVSRAVRALWRSESPLKGVVHCAAVIDDALLGQMDEDRFLRVFRPKVAGAWNLHRALARANADVDFFVGFSSISQLFGSTGQANYVAANMFLDALAHYRSARNLPALTIDWGALRNSGVVARNEALASYLESAGIMLISDEEAGRGMAQMMRLDTPSLAYAAVNWHQLARALPSHHRSPRLAYLASEAGRGTGRIRRELMSAPRTRWPDMLADYFRAELGKVLKVEATSVPLDRPLTELGLDSLSSFELKNRIDSELQLEIPIARFLQTPTIEQMADVIAEVFDQTLKEAKAAAEARAAAADRGQARGTEDAEDALFVASDRQLGLLRMSSAPLTTEPSRTALENHLTVRVSPGLQPGRVGRALQVLTERHLALRLALDVEGDRPETYLVPGDGGRIEVYDRPEAAAFRPLELDRGELWRLALVNGDARASLLCLKAHAAIADQWSVGVLMEELLLICQERELPPACGDGTLRSLMRERRYDEESASSQRHCAFWYETIRDLPATLAFGPHALARAPAGMGRTHGPAGHMSLPVDLTGLTSRDPAAREAALLTAYAGALADATGTGAVAIDRKEVLRPDALRNGPVGPLNDELVIPIPVDEQRSLSDRIGLVARRLALAKAHRAFDLLSSERVFVRELRKAAADLSQVAFVYARRDRRLPLMLDPAVRRRRIGALTVTKRGTDGVEHGCGHDICVTVWDRGRESELRITHDSKNISRSMVQRIAHGLLSRISGARPEADLMTMGARDR